MNNMEVGQAIKAFDVDPAHSTIEFKVRHLGFSKVTGRFTRFDAHFEFDPGDLESLRAEVTIDASSVDTGDAKRDEHLRSADFFEVDTYPEIRFRSSRVKDIDGRNLTLEGEMTIRDVTRTVELKGQYLGEAADPWGGRRVAFEGKTKIDRKEFGLTWNQMLETGGVLVGNDVEIMIDVQGVLRQEES